MFDLHKTAAVGSMLLIPNWRFSSRAIDVPEEFDRRSLVNMCTLTLDRRSRSGTDAGMSQKHAGGEEFMYAATWRVYYTCKSGMAPRVLELALAGVPPEMSRSPPLPAAS